MSTVKVWSSVWLVFHLARQIAVSDVPFATPVQREQKKACRFQADTNIFVIVIVMGTGTGVIAIVCDRRYRMYRMNISM